MISEIHSPDHLMRTSTPFIGGMWLQLMVNDRNGLQQSICLVKSTEYAVKDSIMVWITIVLSRILTALTVFRTLGREILV